MVSNAVTAASLDRHLLWSAYCCLQRSDLSSWVPALSRKRRRRVCRAAATPTLSPPLPLARGVIESAPEGPLFLVRGKVDVTSKQTERKSTVGTTPQYHETPSPVQFKPQTSKRKTAACAAAIMLRHFKSYYNRSGRWALPRAGTVPQANHY